MTMKVTRERVMKVQKRRKVTRLKIFPMGEESRVKEMKTAMRIGTPHPLENPNHRAHSFKRAVARFRAKRNS